MFRRDTNNDSRLSTTHSYYRVHEPLLTRDEDGEEGTDQALKHVADNVPISAWLIIVVEVCERFAYFGLSGPLQNYMQNPHDDPLLPGGLGLGQASASRFNQSFTLFSYLTSIIGAIIADQYLGRLKTIVYSSILYAFGLLALLSSSFFVFSKDLSIGVLILSLLLLAMGSGGIKPNAGPLLAEQYIKAHGTTKATASGRAVLVDKNMTIQRMFSIFYMMVNIGSLSPIATTVLEKNFGFPSAFGLPLLVFFVGFITLLFSKSRFATNPTHESALPNAFRIVWIGLKHRSFESAKSPPSPSPENRQSTKPWDDNFVDEVSSALQACKLFIFYPIFWVAWIQMMTNFVSQAGTMQTHSLPNDILTNLDPLTVILVVPLLDRFVYPFLPPIRPVVRITLGFALTTLAMIYAAFVQDMIYSSPPCYTHPRSPDCFGGKEPNHVHVAIQAPAYLFVALGEILIVPTGYELAVTKAPLGLRSFVTALFMSTVAVGAALAIVVSPMAKNPYLTWMYAGLGGVTFTTGGIFWGFFGRDRD